MKKKEKKKEKKKKKMKVLVFKGDVFDVDIGNSQISMAFSMIPISMHCHDDDYRYQDETKVAEIIDFK